MQVATTSLERAKGLYDLISGEAHESEPAGRLTDRARQALLDGNLFSMLVSKARFLGGNHGPVHGDPRQDLQDHGQALPIASAMPAKMIVSDRYIGSRDHIRHVLNE
jgi:hypothetical protein